MNADVLAEKLPGVGANRIAQDVEGAHLSPVSGTPRFINGRATTARTTSITCRAQSARPSPAPS
jgi:hypothetical protein